MAKHITNQDTLFLNQLSGIIKRHAEGGLDLSVTTEAFQALLEGKPYGESSLSEKVVMECADVKITESFLRQTMQLSNGQKMKRHRNGGGWVPADQDEFDESKPFVAETALVGPFARVFGNARVTGNAKVTGQSMVFGNARISDDAWISQNSMVYGKAIVSDRARVSYDAWVFGDAWLCGDFTYFGEGFQNTGNGLAAGKHFA